MKRLRNRFAVLGITLGLLVAGFCIAHAKYESSSADAGSTVVYGKTAAGAIVPVQVTAAGIVTTNASTLYAPIGATYITQTLDGSLTNEQAIASLNTGLLQGTITTGVISSVTTSAGVSTLISDETGTGVMVFNNSPTFTDDITLGADGVDGALRVYSEQGATDYLVTLNPNATMTSNANFYLPADEPASTLPVTCTSSGVLAYNDQAVAIASSVTFASITDSALTSGRIPIAGASGLLGDDIDLTFSGSTLTLGSNSSTGVLNLYSEIGATDYTASLLPNTGMTSAASFYLPADEPAGTYLLNMTTGGVIGFDNTSYANNVLSNLAATTLINTSLTSDTANTDDLGTEAIFWKELYLASTISFEGATDDAYQTTLTAVDTTLSDKVINIPNANGTIAVSASAPITLSALGDIGLTLSKDITTSGTGMSGGADDVLPGADSDVTITLTTSKDIVAGTGLSGGENDVLPGADADTTISLDLGAADVWTAIHSFQAATNAIILGKDETALTPNVAGALKLWSAGDNAYYTTITTSTQTQAVIAFTLPVDDGASGQALVTDGTGVLSWGTIPGTGANTALSNLASVAINESLTSDTANTDDLGTEALFWKKLYLASDISFEGSTDDNFQTTLTTVDPTADHSINIPNAGGVLAVSATAPITLSALGDVGLTLAKDITVSGTGMSGGADDILPGADADVTIALAVSKDIVAGTGLSGGENDVLPGADADTTISLDLAAADVWTGTHSFQNATAAIILGKDVAGGTTNDPGILKFWSNGDNAYYTTFTASTQTQAAIAYTLPVDDGAANQLLKTDGSGVLSWATAASGATAGTFVNGDLAAGVLTITHNKTLSAPYAVNVKIFDNTAKEVEADTVTGLTNTTTVDLTSYGALTGTWGYIIVTP